MIIKVKSHIAPSIIKGIKCKSAEHMQKLAAISAKIGAGAPYSEIEMMFNQLKRLKK